MHVARDIDDARMPPMMLVPLVAPPANAGTPVHRHDGSIRVDIRRVDGRLRIALAATGGIAHSIADSPAVGDVRARLDALYGARASLAVDASPADRSQLILEIPQ
jgi:LytS/YehU family sensor histidine kinase